MPPWRGLCLPFRQLGDWPLSLHTKCQKREVTLVWSVKTGGWWRTSTCLTDTSLQGTLWRLRGAGWQFCSLGPAPVLGDTQKSHVLRFGAEGSPLTMSEVVKGFPVAFRAELLVRDQILVLCLKAALTLEPKKRLAVPMLGSWADVRLVPSEEQ